MSNKRSAGEPAMRGPVRWLEWAQVDVFAEAPFEGNMLAIFPDATGLSTAQMQCIARETNLSETTFVFPRDRATEQAEGVRVRIFTTHEELPFAGHPTLGTASWLRLHRPEFADATELTLHLNVGPVRVLFPETRRTGEVSSEAEDASSDASTGRPGQPLAAVTAEMIQPDPKFLGNLDRGAVSPVLGLARAELHPELRPEIVSTGLPILVVPLASTAALAGIHPDFARERELLQNTPARFLYCIAQVDKHTWKARLPLYNGEDPATGSAAGCAISYLVRHGAAPAGLPVTLQQGEFVRRPSRIVVQASLHNTAVTDVRVRGCTIPVAHGQFLHP